MCEMCKDSNAQLMCARCPECDRDICSDVRGYGDAVPRPVWVTSDGFIMCDLCGRKYDASHVAP
jgi:uncharacterized protein with PIN domain